jgi:hypothetical protein
MVIQLRLMTFAVAGRDKPRSGGRYLARGVSPGNRADNKWKAPEGRQMSRRDARTTRKRDGFVVHASGLHISHVQMSVCDE